MILALSPVETGAVCRFGVSIRLASRCYSLSLPACLPQEEAWMSLSLDGQSCTA